jgi:hypothetical protein
VVKNNGDDEAREFNRDKLSVAISPCLTGVPLRDEDGEGGEGDTDLGSASLLLDEEASDTHRCLVDLVILQSCNNASGRPRRKEG